MNWNIITMNGYSILYESRDNFMKSVTGEVVSWDNYNPDFTIYMENLIKINNREVKISEVLDGKC